MASDPNTITSTLQRMEKSGLISRNPHETDKRAHRVRMEPHGREIFESAKKLAVELQTGLLSVLPPERRENFLADLEIIANACNAAATKSSSEDRHAKGKKE